MGVDLLKFDIHSLQRFMDKVGMAASLNSLAEFFPVDTRSSSGTILLPIAQSIPGRILTFKDMYGSFGSNPLTLSTQAGDTFEDSTYQKNISDSFGFVTYVSQGNQWFLTDGTVFPMYTLSTLLSPLRVTTNILSTSITKSPLSSLATSVSSFGLVDTQTSQTIPLYTRNRLLYYENLVVAGSKAASGQRIPL